MLDQLPEVYYPVFEMTVFVHDKKMYNEATVTKLIAHKLVLNHVYRFKMIAQQKLSVFF